MKTYEIKHLNKMKLNKMRTIYPYFKSDTKSDTKKCNFRVIIMNELSKNYSINHQK